MAGARLTRRALLVGGAATSAAAFLGGCSSSRDAGRPRGDPTRARRLAPVRVSEDRIIRTVVGLRPFRPSGFVLKADRFGDKTVIHNYGHGGGGVSLSWGTAQMAAEEALATTGRRSAAVLGCGAVGLAAARTLQDRGFEVTIYARDLPPDTTSNVAGAEWWPYLVVDEDRRSSHFDAQFERAARLAFRYFQNLAGGRYGVRWLEGYALSENPSRPPWAGATADSLIATLVPQVPVAPAENPFPVPRAERFHTMHIETSAYLFALLEDFRLAGGRVVVGELSDVSAVQALPEPVVINCTGLGARALFGDAELTPVKGQLSVLVPQPEVDYMTFGPGRLYMMPRRDGVLLGGTTEFGVETLEPDESETRRILEGQRRLFDGMH